MAVCHSKISEILNWAKVVHHNWKKRNTFFVAAGLFFFQPAVRGSRSGAGSFSATA
jgi:hypothetical protein